MNFFPTREEAELRTLLDHLKRKDEDGQYAMTFNAALPRNLDAPSVFSPAIQEILKGAKEVNKDLTINARDNVRALHRGDKSVANNGSTSTTSSGWTVADVAEDVGIGLIEGLFGPTQFSPGIPATTYTGAAIQTAEAAFLILRAVGTIATLAAH